METNQNPAQEPSAQLINTEMLATAQPEQQTAAEPEQAPEAPLLYDPAKAARITECLRELFDPAVILLFGSLAGGTPHSETASYDLLVIVECKSPYNWYDAKRYLKMTMPKIGHRAPCLNIYILTKHEVEANQTPFVYLARREGKVLYRNHGQKFKRPRKTFDFGRAAAVAEKYARTFLPLADRLLLGAERMTDELSIRQSAFAMAQAAVYYFRTLFYVYHGFEADTFDVGILHHRLRTLSGELPLLFESDEFNSIHTLSCLKSFLANARYDPEFFIYPQELEQHLDRVKRLGKVVNKLCRRRINLYIERIER